MKILKQFIVLIFLIISLSNSNNNYVSSKEQNILENDGSTSSSSSSSSSNGGGLGPYQDYDLNWLSKHLTTKTPYYKLTENGDNDSNSASAGSSCSNNEDSASSSSSSTTSNSTLPKQCKLVSIDIVARHGSRLPVESSITKLNQMVSDIYQYQDKISKQFHWIFNWTVPYPTDIAGNLILQGQFEHYNISKRLLSKYPEYFASMKYKPQNYEITSTAISRTGISASSFIYGLLEGTGQLGQDYQPVFHQTASLNEDTLLRFFDTCKYYTDQIKDGTINKDEQLKWQNSVFPNISAEISNRLGLGNIWMPTNTIISDIFESCAYEISINNISDHWCSLLSRQNILDWEYSEDLSNYWIKSYGHKVNYKIASLLLKTIIDGFDNHIKQSSISPNDAQPINFLRFGHAETVIPLISLLGLYKDDQPLFANNTKSQIENRLFRTSVVSPYASNIGLFLFDCSINNDTNSSSSSSSSNNNNNIGDHKNFENFKILIEHNELPIQIPGCDDKYCNYAQFRSIFKHVLDFKWKSYCKVKNHPSPSPSSSSNDNDSHHKHITISPTILAIFIPLTFLIGILVGGVVIYYGRDKFEKKKSNVTLYGFDELIPSPKLSPSKYSKNVNSPLIEKS